MQNALKTFFSSEDPFLLLPYHSRRSHSRGAEKVALSKRNLFFPLQIHNLTRDLRVIYEREMVFFNGRKNNNFKVIKRFDKFLYFLQPDTRLYFTKLSPVSLQLSLSSIFCNFLHARSRQLVH